MNLPSSTVVDLPVDQLGLVVLADLVASSQWSEHNYLVEAGQTYKGEALKAIAEALGWLRARALIARSPDQSSSSAIFVTRAGHRVNAEGPQVFYAGERLQGSLHSLIEKKARPQFLIGEYEQAVFASMKAIEVRVRKLGGFTNDIIGVDLMNKAFGPSGPLKDASVSRGEQDGTRALF